MVVLKKRVLEDGYEYLDAMDLWDESDPRGYETYCLAKACADVLNYFVENTPDAFGNAPYARLDGFLHGYLVGRKMEIRMGEGVWDIVKGRRVVLRVEVPKLPASYHEQVRENARVRREVFGF